MQKPNGPDSIAGTASCSPRFRSYNGGDVHGLPKVQETCPRFTGVTAERLLFEHLTVRAMGTGPGVDRQKVVPWLPASGLNR